MESSERQVSIGYLIIAGKNFVELKIEEAKGSNLFTLVILINLLQCVCVCVCMIL